MARYFISFSLLILLFGPSRLCANGLLTDNGTGTATLAITPNGGERECLATAIAYEAGYEPISGRRAVADVILNRTRSGSHPSTICGVVFEGSTRRTGCQFTFTCDGSLRRRLPARVVDEARQIADEALSGVRPSEIGAAVNYHADYVTPYWASSMLRVAKIGRHIFYSPFGQSTTLVLGKGAPIGGPTPQTLQSKQAKPQPFAPWGIALGKLD